MTNFSILSLVLVTELLYSVLGEVCLKMESWRYLAAIAYIQIILANDYSQHESPS